VREEPQPLAFVARVVALGVRLLAFARVMRDGPRVGLVQAPVQRAKIFRADWSMPLDGELGDCLMDATVSVDDLRDGEPLPQQVVPVLHRAPANVRISSQSESKGVDQ